MRQLRLVNVLTGLALHQLPDKVVKLQGQILVLHITPTDQQRGVVSAALAAQNKVGVRSSDDARRAAYIVKWVLAVLQLSEMMYKQNGDVIVIGNTLDRGNVIVIVAVHSRLSGATSGVSHLLQGIYNNQLGVGMAG